MSQRKPSEQAPERSFESVLQASKQQVNAIESMLRCLDSLEKGSISTVSWPITRNPRNEVEEIIEGCILLFFLPVLELIPHLHVIHLFQLLFLQQDKNCPARIEAALSVDDLGLIAGWVSEERIYVTHAK
jgi:hypothetical protein